MADTRQGGTPSNESMQQRRDSPSKERTPRHMRRDLFDLSSHRLMRRMQDSFDRLFSGSREWPSFFSEAEHMDWAPAIEAFQRGNEFIIRADLPGLSSKDLSIDIGDDSVTISGERAYDHDEEHEGVYRSERSYGAFRRVIGLPEGALTETAKAAFKNGVLEVRMQAPSPSVRRGRRLDITDEGSGQSPQR
jgi:HSP20 family protein